MKTIDLELIKRVIDQIEGDIESGVLEPLEVFLGAIETDLLKAYLPEVSENYDENWRIS